MKEKFQIEKLQLFQERFHSCQILENEPMSKHTTFKAGGNADVLLLPRSQEEILAAVKLCRQTDTPFFIMGNGSNLLVKDSGYRGIIIKISKTAGGAEAVGEHIISEAGTALSTLSNIAQGYGLSGMEFASGIPGTLGGALFMNAGAYDGEIKDVIDWVEVIDEDGKIKRLTNSEMEFSYRSSRLQKEPLIALSAQCSLKQGNQREIKEKMAEFNRRRREKQPVHMPSAGSTFKRPEGYFAGKLIMDSGLKGYKIGGAMVSEMHCGFIVNSGGATAADIISLIEHIQKTVENEFGVRLEREVRILG